MRSRSCRQRKIIKVVKEGYCGKLISAYNDLILRPRNEKKFLFSQCHIQRRPGFNPLL